MEYYCYCWIHFTLIDKREKEKLTYHSLVPDDAHAFFNAIGPFRNKCKIVFAYSFLSCGECAMSAGCHLKIPTVTQFGKIFNIRLHFIQIKQQLLSHLLTPPTPTAASFSVTLWGGWRLRHASCTLYSTAVECGQLSFMPTCSSSLKCCTKF